MNWERRDYDRLGFLARFMRNKVFPGGNSPFRTNVWSVPRWETDCSSSCADHGWWAHDLVNMINQRRQPCAALAINMTKILDCVFSCIKILKFINLWICAAGNTRLSKRISNGQISEHGPEGTVALHPSTSSRSGCYPHVGCACVRLESTGSLHDIIARCCPETGLGLAAFRPTGLSHVGWR